MTKDEKTKVMEREIAGVKLSYICSPVKHQSKEIGFAPRIQFKTTTTDDAEMDFTKALESMIDTFGNEAVFSLADRQLDQDSKNKVRAKFTKEAVTASAVIKALSSGTLKSPDVEQVMKNKNLTYIQAAASLMGVGKEAKIEPEKVHWDIL